MNDLPENELFSAYLDGEVTAAEQAAIEQLLAQNPAARQLMDELRALSATLQSLPVHKLSEDLSQQVLRIAERRMAADPAQGVAGDGKEGLGLRDWGLEAANRMGVSDSQQPIPNPQSPVPSPRTVLPSFLRRAIRPRNLLWPAIAIAAAVMIMVTNSQRLPRGQRGAGDNLVAVAPKDGPRVEESAIGPAAGVEEEASRRYRREVLPEEPRAMAEMARGSTAEPAKEFKWRDDALTRRKDGPSPAGKPSGPAASESKLAVAERVIDKSGVKVSANAGANVGAVENRAGPAAGVANAKNAIGLTIANKAIMENYGGTGRQQGIGLAEQAAPMVAKSEQTAAKLSKKADGPLVVLCRMTPEAMRVGAFERIAKLGAVTSNAAEKAKGSGEKSMESEARILDVELTQTQLNAVLVSLRDKPEYFPFVVENATLDYLAPDYPARGKAGEQVQGVIGKGAPAGQADMGAQQMNALPANFGQSTQQAASVQLQTPVAAQPGLQQQMPALPSTRGVAASQSQMPADQRLGSSGGGFGGRGMGGMGMGGMGGGMMQPGPGAGAAQPSDGISTPRGAPAAPPSAAVQFQKRSPAGASQRDLPAQVQSKQADSAQPAGDRQLPPAGAAGFAGRKAAAQPGGAASGDRMMSLEALKLQAPASDAEQVLRSMTFAQQREQSEAKRRVLFVLQVVPDDSSPATIAKQGPSAKADAAKPAAAPAPSAPAAQSQPGGARANPPGPIPAGKAVQ